MKIKQSCFILIQSSFCKKTMHLPLVSCEAVDGRIIDKETASKVQDQQYRAKTCFLLDETVSPNQNSGILKNEFGEP